MTSEGSISSQPLDNNHLPSIISSKSYGPESIDTAIPPDIPNFEVPLTDTQTPYYITTNRTSAAFSTSDIRSNHLRQKAISGIILEP